MWNYGTLFAKFLVSSVNIIDTVRRGGGGGGVLAMFAYGGVSAMFLGLKFHLKVIFLGLKFANMNFPFFGVRIFSNYRFLLVQLCNTSKLVPCYQIYD